MTAKEKYLKRIAQLHSVLCVGLDTRVQELPAEFTQQSQPQFTWNKWLIEQTAQHAAAYKINTAFYEAQGSQGWQEMAATIAYLKEQYPEILIIADAKRADIGDTSEAYAQAFYDELQVDAVTLHPYLGFDAIEPFFKRTDKLQIILCKTSNAGSGEFQDLDVEGKPLWQQVAQQVSQVWSQQGDCMLVVGATYPEILAEVRAEVGDLGLLVPGVGTQGGELAATLKSGLHPTSGSLLINVSRGISRAEDPSQAAAQLHEQMRTILDTQ
ncbi:MAG: orotidine-5'-phosphate decarboxylase [Patescibacteria group bacterium]